MKLKFVLGVVGAVSCSTSAFANDRGPAIYGGIEGGYDHVAIKAIPYDVNGTKDGFVYGGMLGIQQRVGNSIVLGLEGEATGATTRESAYVGGYSLSLKAGRYLAATLRAGYELSPSLQLFVKGGYTNARATLEGSNGVNGGSISKNLDGYRIGSGFDWGHDKLRFRLEYRYSDYGKFVYNGVNTGLATHRQQVIAGVLYGF